MYFFSLYLTFLSVKMLNCLCCINKVHLKSTLCECFLIRLIRPFLNVCSTAQFYLHNHNSCLHFLSCMHLVCNFDVLWRQDLLKIAWLKTEGERPLGLPNLSKTPAFWQGRDEFLGERWGVQISLSKPRMVPLSRGCHRLRGLASRTQCWGRGCPWDP